MGIVPDCEMLDTAVIPEGDRMGLPAEPDLEFLARAVLAQIVQDRTALLWCKPIDMGGEVAIDEQRLRFVTGCVRTTGCDAFGKTLPLSSRPTSTLVRR